MHGRGFPPAQFPVSAMDGAPSVVCTPHPPPLQVMYQTSVLLLLNGSFFIIVLLPRIRPALQSIPNEYCFLKRVNGAFTVRIFKTPPLPWLSSEFWEVGWVPWARSLPNRVTLVTKRDLGDVLVRV